MKDLPVSTGRAFYARAEAVWACPPFKRAGRRGRIAGFAAHVAAVLRAPSVFGPAAGDPAVVAAEVERADWNGPLWHLFARDGVYRESVPAETVSARWLRCGAEPFLCVPARAEVFRLEARVEGSEASFVMPFSDGIAPTAAFRGLIRYRADGAPLVPADMPLFLQAAHLLRGPRADADLHLFHLEIMWRLLRPGAADPGTWADMKVTTDLLDWPDHVRRAPSDDAAVAGALVSADLASAEIAGRGGARPALIPPRPRWETGRRRQA